MRLLCVQKSWNDGSMLWHTKIKHIHHLFRIVYLRKRLWGALRLRRLVGCLFRVIPPSKRNPTNHTFSKILQILCYNENPVIDTIAPFVHTRLPYQGPCVVDPRRQREKGNRDRPNSAKTHRHSHSAGNETSITLPCGCTLTSYVMMCCYPSNRLNFVGPCLLKCPDGAQSASVNAPLLTRFLFFCLCSQFNHERRFRPLLVRVLLFKSQFHKRGTQRE